jgi:hypothetical protein
LSFILVSLLSGSLYGGGKLVTLALRDSSSVSGELLAVVGNRLVIALEPWASERKLVTDSSLMKVVPIADVLMLHIAGHRNALLGAGIGVAVGMGVGAVIGYAAPTSGESWTRSQDLNAFLGGVAGILPGLFGGIVVGLFVETGGKDGSPNEPGLLDALSTEARYPKDVPVFIRRLVP